MKKVWFTILPLIFISDLTVISQDLIYAPAFKFSGTPIQWHHRPHEDSGDKQVGPIIKTEQLLQYKKPVQFGNRVFFLLDNATMESASGSLLICYDYNTGDSLWQNNYNSKFYGKGFTFFWDFRQVQDHLELFGYATIDTILFGRRSWYSGFTSRMEVDTDGKDLLQQINLNAMEGVGFQASDPPIYLEGSDFALYYKTGFHNDTQVATHGIYPHIWDKNLKKRAIPEHNILFKESSQNTIELLNGPVQMDPLNYVYFFSIYFYNTKNYKHYIFRTDPFGKYSGLKDVTSVLGERNRIIGYEKSGSRIRLKLNSPYQDRFPGNAGYLYLDAEGKILKDQRAWQIDGEVVGHVSSVDLMDSSEILHVIRFVDKHNIYFYKERADGTLYRCGELIHENEPRYAFLPKYVLQAPDRGIILTFVGALDSVYAGENFVLGGWPYICKIKGEDLMIVSGNSEKQMDEYIVHPNPFGDKFRVRLPESAIGAEIRIYDSAGRRVLSRRYDCRDYELPTQDLTPGSYQVQIYRESRLVYQTTAVKTGTQ